MNNELIRRNEANAAILYSETKQEALENLDAIPTIQIEENVVDNTTKLKEKLGKKYV